MAATSSAATTLNFFQLQSRARCSALCGRRSLFRPNCALALRSPSTIDRLSLSFRMPAPDANRQVSLGKFWKMPDGHKVPERQVRVDGMFKKQTAKLNGDAGAAEQPLPVAEVVEETKVDAAEPMDEVEGGANGEATSDVEMKAAPIEVKSSSPAKANGSAKKRPITELKIADEEGGKPKKKQDNGLEKNGRSSEQTALDQVKGKGKAPRIIESDSETDDAPVTKPSKAAESKTNGTSKGKYRLFDLLS